MMSSGTCNAAVDGGKCPRLYGHPGDHLGPATVDRCGAKQSENSLASCKSEKGHAGRHSDPAQGVSWPREPASPPQPEDGPDYVIPNSVRTRVELHRAQTAYDLTVLRERLDTITVSTAESRRLRARREQLIAELDAWAYLAKMAKNPR